MEDKLAETEEQLEMLKGNIPAIAAMCEVIAGVLVYKQAHDKLVQANEDLDLANVVEEVSSFEVLGT